MENVLPNIDNMQKLKSRAHYGLLFIMATINLLVAYFYLGVLSHANVSYDTPSYVAAMKFLQGESFNGPMPYNRLLTTPLMLYSSIFFGGLFGDPLNGILAVNLIFYFAAIYVFYRLVLVIYGEARVAFFGAALFVGNYCLYNFGTTYVADMGGWFFFLLGTLFAAKYYNDGDRRYYYLSILAAAIGVLFKEYGALGLVSLSFVILLSDFSWQRKIRELLTAAFLFLIVPLAYHVGFYFKFNFSYFDWYFYNLNNYVLDSHDAAARYSPVLLIKVLGWLFFSGWPIFAFGLWQEKKFFNRRRALLLLALLPASLTFLAWPALTQRIAFIFIPWLALVAGLGLSKIRNDYLVGTIIIAYFMINYITPTVLINFINMPF